MKHTPQEDNLNSTFDILVNAAALMADSPIAVLHLEEGQTSQLYTYNPGGIEWEPDTFTGYRSNDVFEIQTNTSVEKGTSLVNIFPFFTLEGTYLGYLCVMDPAKKELCADSRHKLDAIVLHVRELLESKWAKREMRRYQNLVENIGDMIFELDENGFFTYVNSSSVEITGYSKEELRQMRYQDVLDEPSIDELGKIIKDNLKNQNKTSYLECQILTKEKGKLDISLRMHFVFDGNWLVRAFAIGRDITELVKTQNQLLESEEKYRLISENFRDLIILHNIDGSYRYISSSVRDMLGYEADELIGYDPYRLIHPEDLVKIFDEPERKRLEGGIIKNTEFRIKDKKDIYHWFESYTKPIYDRKNKLIAFQSFSRDITIQKENQEKFQKTDADLNRYKEGLKLLNEITSNTELSSKKQIEQALWASTEFLGMKNGMLSKIDGQKFVIDNCYSVENTFWIGQSFAFSETFSELVYNRNEIIAIEHIGKTTYKIHPAYDLFKIESYIGISYYVSGKKRGTVVFTSSLPRSEPFSENDFEYIKLLARWIGFIQQHREYENNLMQDKIILQAFVSTAPAAIAMFDKDMKYIAASDKWYSDYDLDDEYIIGKSYFEVLPEIGQDWEGVFQRAMMGNVESNDQDLIEKSNGEIQWIKWEVRPWYKKLDTVGGLIMYTEDISQQKEQQLQLKIAKRKAEQASKAKEQFLSSMSHEIRTPLNAIIGMTDLMLMEDQEEEQLKRLQLLKFSSGNLLALINDILDFNKIEAGKMEFEVVDFDLKLLLEKNRETMLPLAEKKSLEFNLNYDPNLPQFVKGDMLRINQVLTNLVNNAIKFTEEGYVTLKARLVQVENNLCTVKFEVKDTGIGIPEDKIESIFQSFEQASADTTRKYGGSGLGLAISKRILALMDSDIQVSTTENLGSTFYFEITLPIGKGVSHQIKKEAIKELSSGLRVLVAEDNEGNRVLIESLFKKWEIHLVFAFNGEEAVEKIVSQDFDMVFMDLQMPVLDGYEATRKIREIEGEYFKKVPIIALTASVLSNVLEKTKDVGMNGYVPKPFNPENLKKTIATYTSGSFTVEKNEQEEAPNPFPYISSLIGGDKEALHEIVKASLESIEKAIQGLKKGIGDEDIVQIRQELHVLRPNLHNLELNNLISNLPSITEWTKGNGQILGELAERVESEISSNRFKKYRI